MDETNRNSMSYPELIAWAWRETPPVHTSRANLLIHLFAVPLFVTGHVLIVAALFDRQLMICGISSIILSLVLQNIGHRLERVAPPPFLGPKDFVRRLYAEQFYNFWRFLVSGGWYASFKAAG